VIDRRSVLLGAVTLGAASKAGAQTKAPATTRFDQLTWPDPAETIDLWPGSPPGSPRRLPVETVKERSTDPAYNDRYVFGISRPRMAVFRPEKPNGSAVLIMPGGSYRWVVIDKEGYEMARWLNQRGVTAFVLFYRLPGEGWLSGPDTPLVDAQRAVRLIRHRAGIYGVDPARICALGFSAGGHACASLLTRFAARVYRPVDEADSLSARPDIAAPVYPVISMSTPTAHRDSRAHLIGAQASAELERAYNPALNVPPDAPAAFLCHAEDDPSVPVANTLMFREGLLRAKVAVETHLYPSGGHGFGLRLSKGKSVEGWQEVFFAWGRKHKIL
jgi:acetyl esterase/lipase